MEEGVEVEDEGADGRASDGGDGEGEGRGEGEVGEAGGEEGEVLSQMCMSAPAHNSHFQVRERTKNAP